MKLSTRLLLFFFIIFFIGSGSIWIYVKWSLFPISPLTEIVSDCEWSPHRVDIFNNEKLYPALESLCERIFFTYFKVNYWRDCEIWPEEEGECTSESGSCDICPCDSDEIPESWRCEDLGGGTDKDKDKLITNLPDKEESKDEQFWNRKENQKEIEELWTIHDLSEEYINLRLNPERNTGYGGPHAAKIWGAIYKENCFSGKFENQCLEERVFYRLVSGIHGSTAVQVAERFDIQSHPMKQSNGPTKLRPDLWKFSPNVKFFVDHIGKWPNRATNIYFTWSLLLRAFHKAREFLLTYPFNTGNLEDDHITSQLIQQVLKEGECPTAGFDEKSMFSGGHYKEVLKSEFKKKFLNVSMIMDCVACQNCRIHGKLSMLGIASAMKILLDQSPEEVHLERNEVIALVNTLFKFSESIRIIELMKERVHKLTMEYILYLFISLFILYISTLEFLRNIFVKNHKSPESVKPKEISATLENKKKN